MTIPKTNTSGFKGVYLHRAAKKFVARITVAGATHYLGLFDTAEKASEAYMNAARHRFGDFATEGR